MKNFTGILLAAVLLGGSSAGAEIMTAPMDLNAVRAFPNPWKSDRHSANPLTIDRLPQGSVSTVRIFTISGELVQTLSGTESVQWDLNNSAGSRVASGIYLYMVQTNGQQKIGKIAVIR
jgi:hypothetical protein